MSKLDDVLREDSDYSICTHECAQLRSLPPYTCECGSQELARSARAELAALRAEVAHWKANHDEMKARNDVLRDRLDLDAEQVKPRLALLDRYDALRIEVERLRDVVAERNVERASLKAENAKLREVAQRVVVEFHPFREVEHVDNGPDDPKEVPTGELLCGSCAQGLDHHDDDCLYAMAERALANGGTGGG